jgi:replication-associated recombination protein RarA
METFEMKTVNNYDFFECSSAFQKSIRRGDEKQALFFGVELAISNYDEYVWKRMKIISSEDIGLANPSVSSEIYALYQLYAEQKKKKDEKHFPERLYLIHAILLLVRSPKSRIVDWALVTAFEGHHKEMLPVPDCAYDKHNRKGRALGRGMKHFFEEGCKLNNHNPQIGEDEYMKESWKLLNKESTQDELF